MRAGALKIAIALAALAGAAGLTHQTLSAYSSAASNAGSTFATAASYSTCPNQTITGGYTTGFEHGRIGFSVGLVAQGVGSSTIDNAVARTGTYSLKTTATGAAAYALRRAPGTSPTTQIVRFALRLNTLPAANVTQLFGMDNLQGITVQLRYLSASQKLAIALTGTEGGSTTVVPATTTVTAGAWHVIEIRYANGTTTHTADWQIDEVAQTGASIAGTATAIARAFFGTETTDTFTANYDDVLIAVDGAAYPLGDGRVRALSPDGMGTSVGLAGFKDDDGTAVDAASWQRLDEIPMTSAADFIQQTGGTSTDYVEVTFANTTETCIRATHGLVAVHSTSQQANVAKASMFDAAQETILIAGSTTANTTEVRDYGKPLTPASTWTQAAVNGLVGRAGYGGDLNPTPIFDAFLVEYEVPQ
jgi:hypothetical protein